mmetsp:Transcript_43693/g.49489  ORF Transcript_43693/g.49489 Transcript_43693/m.49489 type:complete len:97 (+) Transcript_43693:1570-1860(+)
MPDLKEKSFITFEYRWVRPRLFEHQENCVGVKYKHTTCEAQCSIWSTLYDTIVSRKFQCGDNENQCDESTLPFDICFSCYNAINWVTGSGAKIYKT